MPLTQVRPTTAGDAAPGQLFRSIHTGAVYRRAEFGHSFVTRRLRRLVPADQIVVVDPDGCRVVVIRADIPVEILESNRA